MSSLTRPEALTSTPVYRVNVLGPAAVEWSRTIQHPELRLEPVSLQDDLSHLEPQLMLLDSQLGLDALRNLRKQNFLVIVLLNSYDESTAQKTLAAGACDYLERDELNAKSLLKVIRKALQRPPLSQNAELAGSEGKLYDQSQILEKSPVMLVRWTMPNLQTVSFKFVSQNISQFGYSSEELLSGEVSWLDIMHPDDFQPTYEKYIQLISGQSSHYLISYRIKTKAGKWRWIEDHSSIERHPDGRVKYFQGLIIDISERKDAELALQQTQAIVDHSPIMLYRWKTVDGKPRFLYISQNIANYGYSPEQLLKGEVSWSTICHPEDLSEVNKQIGNAIKTGEDHITLYYRVFDKQGSLHWLEDQLRIRRHPDGSVKYFEGFNLNISERRLAESRLRTEKQKLQQQTNLFETVMNAIPDAICYRDSDLRFLYTNAQFRKNFLPDGLDPIGKTSAQLSTSKLAKENQKSDSYILEHKQAVLNLETKIMTESGDVRWVQASKVPTFEGETLNGIVSLTRDITELKEKERLLHQQATIIAQAKDRVSLIDTNYRYIFANQANLDFHHKTLEEMVGMSVSEIIGKEAFEQQAKDQFDRCFRGESITQEEAYVRNGVSGFREISIIPFKENDRIVGAIVGLRDITEQKQAEKALSQQNTYLQALHETALGLMNRLELNELLDSLVTKASQLSQVEHGYLYLVKDGTLELVAGTGMFKDLLGLKMGWGEGASGQVWQTGEALYINDYAGWEKRSRTVDYGNINSTASIPLKIQQKVLGVIGFVSEEYREFESESTELLENFAQLASLALDNAQLFQKAQDELEERKILELNLEQERNALSQQTRFRTELASLVKQSLSGELNQQFFQNILQKATEVIPGAEAGSLLVRDDLGNFRFETAVNYDIATLQHIYLKPHEIYRDLNSSEPLRVFDIGNDEVEDDRREQLEQAANLKQIKVALSVPIFVEGQTVALFSLDNFSHQNSFSDESLEMVKIFADQIAALWQRFELENNLRQERSLVQEFKDKLKALHDLGIELEQITDFDKLCYEIVAKGRKTLEIDRLGLFFTKADEYKLYGVYGTDTEGRIRNEQDIVADYSDSPHLIAAHTEINFTVLTTNDTVDSELDGQYDVGWHLHAPLRQQQQIIGWLFADNYINQKPIKPYEDELFSLFGRTVSNLISSKRAELNLRTEQTLTQEFKDRLKTLQVLSVELSHYEELEDLYFQIVSKARSALGFDRVAFLLDNGEYVQGCYGTATDGQIRAEHKLSYAYADLPEFYKAKQQHKAILVHDTPLKDGNKVLGSGWQMMAPVLTGSTLSAWLVADNLLDQKSLRPYEPELLSLYADAISHILRIKRASSTLKENEQRYRKLFIEATQTSKELELLDKLQTAIANKLELTELFETVLSSLTKLFNFDTIIITLIKENRIVRGPYHASVTLPESIGIHEGLAGLAARTGNPQLLSDVRGAEYYIATQPNIISSMALPFYDGSKVMGVIIIENSRLQIHERDFELMKKVVAQLNLAIENTNLLNHVKKDLSYTQALYQISQTLHSAETIEGLMESIIGNTREALSARWVSMYKLNMTEQSIEHHALTENAHQPLRPLSFPELQKGLIGWTLKHAKPALVSKTSHDVREDPDFAQALNAGGIGSRLYVPLIYQGQILGLLAAVNHQDDTDFNQADLELLSAIGNQSSVALAQYHLRKQIEHQAFHDALTGLPNRVLFEDRLTSALAQAERYKTTFATLFIDLDGFKHINDTLGHHMGDALLQEVSKRLKARTRDSDTLARMGGDEFALILNNLRYKDDALRVAQSYLELFQGGFKIGEQNLFVGASIGVSLYPDDGRDISSLLKHADSAMYQAKAGGKNNVRGFTHDLAEQAKKRLELETALRNALPNKELELFYQPQIDLETGKRLGVEALLRWNSASHGFVSPMQFIPIAEETGLILAIGDWVLREACRQNVAWQKAGFPPMKVAVNISSMQFERANFVANVIKTLDETGLDPHYLELEVTESVVMKDVNQVISRLQELRDFGISIAIDDFGTGYSSLKYLQKLPLDNLKIDRSFINTITSEASQAPLVSTIIVLAQSFKLRTTAEGIETQEQLNYLKNLGCTEAQGYFFAKPLPAHEVWK
ncbi:MAG: EAL domain-containing protein [Trueperaceae bacterium]|nr:EAL domain-containing protein [Trueperaceae bacterium]